MNIKFRLSFQFMLIVAGILLFFASLVYYFTFTTYRDKFRNNLLNRAKNTALLLIDLKEVDSTLLKKIHQSTFSWSEEELVVTDTNLRIKYSNNLNDLSYSILQSEIFAGEKSYFKVGKKDGVFFRHKYKSQEYYSYALAYDSARYIYLKELRQILFWSIIFSLWLSVLFSYLFSRKAIQPVSEIVESVKAINSANLDKRLDEGNRRDEIEQLAVTFNQMLNNLEIAFKNQQEFVSNASHELKTPVSVMIAESEYILHGDHREDDYRKYLSQVIGDMKMMDYHINSLLDLAQVNSGRSMKLSECRLDEILYDAVREMKNRYRNRRIITRIQFPENDNDLLVLGNPGLLQIAVKNLIDNACKFSDNDVTAELVLADEELYIVITDSGIGIPDHEINEIYKPFSRATNAKYKSGFGIGLSLVARILEIHNVKMNVFSRENKGTRFELIFKRLESLD